MSRQSDYTHQDIVNLCSDMGFDYIDGQHINSQSKHTLRCRICLHKCTKTSKQICAEKGCYFIPCKEKGILTLQYIQKVLEPYNISLLPPPNPTDTNEIYGQDKFIFKLIDDIKRSKAPIMTARWGTLRERMINNRPVFVPDNKKNIPREQITPKYFDKIIQPHNLSLADGAEYPTNRRQKVLLKCNNCKSLQHHTPTAIEQINFSGCKCHRAKKLFYLLQSTITSHNNFSLLTPDLVLQEYITIAKKKIEQKEKEKLYRNIRPNLICKECNQITNKQSSYQIIYQYLLFCSNNECHTYQALRYKSEVLRYDHSSEAIQHNALYLTDNYDSLLQFRKDEAYTHYRISFGPSQESNCISQPDL